MLFSNLQTFFHKLWAAGKLSSRTAENERIADLVEDIHEKHGFQSFLHLIQIGDANNPELLFRKIPTLFKLTDLIYLILPGQQHHVIAIQPEHTVQGHIAGCVQNVHIERYIPGALPLVDIQSGSCGKQHPCFQEVKPRESPITLANPFRTDMFIMLFQHRVVSGFSQVDRFLPPSLQLVADGLENIPVPLVVRENHQGNPLIGCGLSAPKQGAQPHLQGTNQVEE